MALRVMFYVQHLLGIGHLKRAALLCAAMVEQEYDVLVVLGGRDVPGIGFDGATIVRLPTAHVMDHTFTPLLGEDGKAIDEPWKQRRTKMLLETFHAFRPDVILTEMFPFGRRQFRFELLPLLDAARAAEAPALIVSSVRDILVQKNKLGHDRETATFVRDRFDLVLVHGDPLLTTLDETFPEAKSITDLIHYTGYVAPEDQDANASLTERDTNASMTGQDEVIVSAGGGAVGAPLFTAAMAARPLSSLAHKTWRFVTGPNLGEDHYQALIQQAPNGVIVERFRADLPHMFNTCALSISQGGYNTVMDLLRARTTAIVVPYEDGGESEQRHRARLLAQRNVLNVIDAPTLSPVTLAQAIDRAIPPRLNHIDLAGAETTARLIFEAVRVHTDGDIRYG